MIKKSILNELFKKASIDAIERHLIYSFILNHKLDYKKSPLLNNYFNNIEIDANLVLIASKLNLSNIKELENHLELLIPDIDRKVNGAFFTPCYIIDFIIKEINPKEYNKILDPSCGCGAFLIGIIDYFQSKYHKTIKDILKENIYGVDILSYNINRAKILFSIIALQHNEYINDNDFNLIVGDSLRLDWNTTFKNYPIAQFDVIIGNPPYVKFQDLSDENRMFLSNNWKTIKNGTFNLYFAFFELGHKLLKENGKLGYITPNNYFTSLAGESLRNYFQQNQCIVRIIDFSHKKVFDAQTYTAITFLNKEKNPNIIYDRINNDQKPEDFLNNLNGSINKLKELNNKKWRLLKSDEQFNIKQIETIGTPINKLFDICVGIATLKDELYFVDGKCGDEKYFFKTINNFNFKIEKEITKSVYKISDFKNQEECYYNKRRIIFPYKLFNGNAVPIQEDEMKDLFPECYNYFNHIKNALNKRDKGKVQLKPFYAYGRTQGLTKQGKKILSPTFSKQPRFLIVKEEDAFFTNGYGFYFKENISNDSLLFTDFENPLTNIDNIFIVQKILNSFIMHYYITKTSVSIAGGYPCYQKNFIQKFTIPPLSNDDIKILSKLKNKKDMDVFLIDKYHLKLPSPNLIA